MIARSALADLARLIDGIPVAMVTTRADDERLGSRPMLLERLEPDGSLTFLTHLSSDKVHENSRDPRVNVAFVGDKGDRYVSVSGVATATHDPARMKALWKPDLSRVVSRRTRAIRTARSSPCVSR